MNTSLALDFKDFLNNLNQRNFTNLKEDVSIENV